ncbi:hypothetical protein ACIS_01071 [Anaplasma centrale str. Israel]|uniref:Uncharacterized protein n=2 Tax=Anaplasma centrale TaxID=769 RepID=D1ASU4_ANACI|nr:hypothetical protein ACIS_01071 [Anaplasma centrale str. Israel]
MSFLGLRHESKIAILIGDNGVIVVHIADGEVRDKLFVENVESKEWNDVKSCIVSNKKSQVYFILDHSNQAYTRHPIPATSALVAKSIAGKKSNNIVSKDGLSAAFLNSEFPNDDGSWECMFVESAIQSELFSSLLELLSEHALSNIRGIMLLSTELANIATTIRTKSSLLQKKWIIFLVYTKAGDLRQVVLCNGKLFSSITVEVLRDERELPDVMSGKVHQEAQNALQGIAAAGGTCDNSDVEMCLVVSGSVKSSLLALDFKGVDVSILTPYELGKLLDIKNCVGVGSIYCDTILLYFASHHPAGYRPQLHTKGTISYSRARLLQRVGIIPTCVAIFVVAILNVLWSAEVTSYVKKRSELRATVKSLTDELLKLRSDREFVKVNEMYEAVDLYRSLSGASPCPIGKAIVPLGKLGERNFDITSFLWSVREDFKVAITLGITIKSGESEEVESRLSGVFADYNIRMVRSPNGKQDFTVYLEKM